MAEWVLDGGVWWYHSAGKNPRRHRGESRKCLHCGSSFLAMVKRRNGRNKGAYCSVRCSGLHTARRGPDSPAWKRGYEIDKDGYVRISTGVGKRRRLEHRVVMEQTLGRSLRRDETVHHLNGDRSDNRPENLQLRARNHGPGQAYACADCGSHNISPVAL